MKYLLIALNLLVFSCSNKVIKEKDLFKVSELDNSEHSNNLPGLPKHPFSYYGRFNIIFDSTDQAYFYLNQFDPKLSNHRVIDFDLDVPIFIGLTPEKLVAVPDSSLLQLFQANLRNNYMRKSSLIISSVKDTFESYGLREILDYMKDTSNQVKVEFRRATYEEKVILDFKKSGEYFDGKKFVWDSTQVLFFQYNRLLQ